MDIKQLRCFVTAVETGNFTRASEQLNIAQSALSRQITNLETALGMQLFERLGRGVALTPQGRHAYERARKLLTEFDLFRQDVPRTADDRIMGTLSLAAHGGVGPHFLPQVARLLWNAGERVKFQLSEALSEQIERKVCAGDCDVGIVIRRRGFQVERTDLETVKLVDDDMYGVHASGGDDPAGADWTMRDLLACPLVAAPGGSIERASLERAAKLHDVKTLHIIGEAALVSQRLELARRIGGTCLLPGLALSDLLTGDGWTAHRMEKDDYLNGIEWFAIYRRTEGDRLTRAAVEIMRREAAALLSRSLESLGYGL